MSALGFYPLNPVGGVYEPGIPLYRSARINLPDGKTFEITRDPSGAPAPDSILHTDITSGGSINFPYSN